MNPVDCLLVYPPVDGVVVDCLGPCRLVGHGHGDLLVFGQAAILKTVDYAVIGAVIFAVKQRSIVRHILHTDLLLLGLSVGYGGVIHLLVPCGGHDAPDLLRLGGLGAAGI